MTEIDRDKIIDYFFKNSKPLDKPFIRVSEEAKELAKQVLYDLQIACFKNQIVDTIFHYPVPLTTLYDYLISRTGITQKEFDDLTEKAMRECGLLEDNENVENN